MENITLTTWDWNTFALDPVSATEYQAREYHTGTNNKRNTRPDSFCRSDFQCSGQAADLAQDVMNEVNVHEMAHSYFGGARRVAFPPRALSACQYYRAPDRARRRFGGGAAF
jgi:hypothetical protein